jgi:ABC-2 type transport system ATP-binding protein
MTTRAIELEQLTKVYEVGTFRRRQVRALQGFDLTVAPGEVFGLLGPNGAGKSTTIKILLNLIRATSGRARLFGRDTTEREARQLVGFLPENPAPYDYLTGREFVHYAGQLAGLGGDRLTQNVSRVLEQVGMTAASALQIRKYSKGMTQRIALAQALVAEPRLLVLDEPTSGLDVLGRQLIRDIILAERARGTTVLLCSHIIPDVEALCDKVAVLIGGRVVKQGPVSALLGDVATQVEVVLDGVLDEALVASLGVRAERRGARLVVRCEEQQVAGVLRRALDANGRVVSVQRERYTLEALFLEAVKQSEVRVGSFIE